MHLGIGFLQILVDFGNHVGKQNRTQIDQKRYRKNDGKKKGSKMANKTLQEPTRVRDQGPRAQGEGVGGEVNLSPEGCCCYYLIITTYY